MSAIVSILDRCQRNQAYHRKSIGLLRKELANDTRTFMREWVLLLNRILAQSKREAHVKRLIKLVTSFAVSCDDEFIEITVDYLLRAHIAKEWGARYGACQLIASILRDLGEEASLSDDCWNKINTAMMHRLSDRSPAVRPQAVAALARLQDPRDPKDEITNKFLDMLQYEPSADVRKAIVKHIAITKVTIREIVNRTRDIDAKVRKAAFVVLASFVNIKNLRIAQRVELISDGLRDRDSSVVAECEKMCISWYRQLGNDIIGLLKCLDVSLCTEEAHMLLKLLLKNAEGVNVALDLEKPLSQEESVFMRGLAQFWADQGTDEALELLENNVPELSTLCDMIRMNQEDPVVVYHLLQLASLRDFGDEAGRRELSALLREMLPSPQTSHSVIESSVELLHKCHTDERDFIQVVLEAISDIREPLDVLQTEQAQQKLQSAQERADALKLTYRKLKKLIKTLKPRGDSDKLRRAHAKAQQVKPELMQLEKSLQARRDLEEHIWHRVLSMTEMLLVSTKRGLAHSGILAMKEAVLMPALASAFPMVRELGLRCLALYCLLDVTTVTVKEHIHQFTSALRLENESSTSVRTTAVKAVFDILMLYGFSTFTEAASQISGADLVECLTAYVTDEAEDPEMRGLVVEGFAKLFLMNQCDDLQMLSNLCLLFFSPSTNDDVRLRQCLSVFFPTFAFSAHGHQQLCADAVVLTLRRVLLGPPDSQLKQIDWTKFAKFMLHLADPGFAHYDWVWDSAEPSWIEKITLEIAFEMRGPEAGHLKMWARVLNLIIPKSPVVAGDQEATHAKERFMMKTLMALKDGAERSCTDKQALKWITKFTGSIDAIMTDKRTRDLLLEEQDITDIYEEIVVELKEFEARRATNIDEDPIVLLRSTPATVLVESPARKKGRAGAAGEKRVNKPKSKGAKAVSQWGFAIKKAPTKEDKRAAKVAQRQSHGDASEEMKRKSDPIEELLLEEPAPIDGRVEEKRAKVSEENVEPDALIV